MKKISRSLIVLTILLLSFSAKCQNKPTYVKPVLSEYNFIVANDLGRNGYYDQKTIAETMGKWAEKADTKFVAAAGDIHHFNGVASVNDPLWMTNYELIYSNPSLMLDWYAILGNHEYRGNTQACLDYGKVSRRWIMPSRYYTMVKRVDDKTSIRLVFIDTTPLISFYRNDSTTYPDAYKQDENAELHYIDSVLSASHETWKIVIGHHPIFAYTAKRSIDREEMQHKLDPILKKYNVDYYICGHIHNFQHIKMNGSDIDYIVNSSGSLSRNVKPTEGTQFCSSLDGFLICSVANKKLSINMIDKNGNCIYSYSRTK